MLTTHLGVVPRLMSSAIPLLSLYASMASAGTALIFCPSFLFYVFQAIETGNSGCWSTNCWWYPNVGLGSDTGARNRLRGSSKGGGWEVFRIFIQSHFLLTYCPHCYFRITHRLDLNFCTGPRNVLRRTLPGPVCLLIIGGQDDNESDLDH
jgi:hypothetical protein